jgi:hypothetical protein
MASKARLENLIYFNRGSVSARTLNSSFNLHPETIDTIWNKYGHIFADFTELCMLLNYIAEYPKSDDIFSLRWGLSRQSFKNKLLYNLARFHETVDEVSLNDLDNKTYSF